MMRHEARGRRRRRRGDAGSRCLVIRTAVSPTDGSSRIVPRSSFGVRWLTRSSFAYGKAVSLPHVRFIDFRLSAFGLDVCYNFCYRDPRNAIELLLHWFIASEIGIATSIQRVRPASQIIRLKSSQACADPGF